MEKHKHGARIRHFGVTLAFAGAIFFAACGDNTTIAPAPVSPTPAATGGKVTTAPAATTVPVEATTAPAAGAPGRAPGGLATYRGKIAYEVRDGVKSQIFISNPDGTGVQKVADGSSPIMSPDGKQIAFLVSAAPKSNEPFGTLTLRITGLDGANPQDYCSVGENADTRLGSWSPQNTYISMSGTQNGGSGMAMLCDLKTRQLNIDGRKVFEMKFKQGTLSAPFEWTADGSNAVWQVDEYSSAGGTLYYGDPTKAGNGAVALTKGENRASQGFEYYTDARISPDGKTVAIAGSKIFFVSVPGQHSPLEGKSISAFDKLDRIAWSPDGKSLAVSHGERMGEHPNEQIDVIDIESGKVTKMAEKAVLGDWGR